MRRLLTLLVLLVAAAPAHASELQRVGGYSTDEAATEIEVAGDLAFVVTQAGVYILSIRDPAHPRRLGFLDCTATFDIAMDPAAQIAAVAIDNPSTCLSSEGVLVVDIRNPTAPEILSTIEMPEGAHTVTMDGRTLYANQQVETLQTRRLEIFDLSDPLRPRALPVVEFPGHGPHDSYVRNRPDGRRLVYTANIETANVIDATDASAPRLLQTVRDPTINYAHQAEVSHDDNVLLVSDEMLIGNAAGACGKAPASGQPDIGSLHFYGAAPDGTFASEGLERLGSWNVPLQASGLETCTIHVFVQAPDSRRVLAAWYNQGIRVADFTDPANVQELAAFVADDSRARQAIAHNGYIYAADLYRGMDVLRYTGSGWPATAGPAEAYRFGKPAAAPPVSALPPALPAPVQRAGRAKLKLKLRRAGKLAITDARGVQVAALRVPRRARVEVVAVPGRYAWTVRAGRRRIARGRFTIRRAVDGLTLPSGRVARARRT